jgi:hypothetical protein
MKKKMEKGRKREREKDRVRNRRWRRELIASQKNAKNAHKNRT